MRAHQFILSLALAFALVPVSNLQAEGEQGLLSEMYNFSQTYTADSMADLGGQETTAGTILLKGNEETDCLFCLEPDVGTMIGAIYQNTGEATDATSASVLYAWHEDVEENGTSNARYVGAQFALWARMKSLDRSVLEDLVPGSANQTLAEQAKEYALAYYDRSLELSEAASALSGNAYELSAQEWTIEEGQESHVFRLQSYADGIEDLLKDVTYTVTCESEIEIQDESGNARTEFAIDEPFVVVTPLERSEEDYVLDVTVRAKSAASTEIWKSEGVQSFAMYAEKPYEQQAQTLTVRFAKKEAEKKSNTGFYIGAGVVLIVLGVFGLGLSKKKK